MWLSKKLADSQTAPSAEQGKVTLSGAGIIEAEGTHSSRRIQLCQPYGYAAGIPAGEDVMLLPAADCLLAFGTTEQTAAPEPGEIVITSRGGASIALKNDGTVVINRRLMIDKEGNILS